METKIKKRQKKVPKEFNKSIKIKKTKRNIIKVQFCNYKKVKDNSKNNNCKVLLSYVVLFVSLSYKIKDLSVGMKKSFPFEADETKKSHTNKTKKKIISIKRNQYHISNLSPHIISWQKLALSL